jgi:hypothetical protein
VENKVVSGVQAEVRDGEVENPTDKEEGKWGVTEESERDVDKFEGRVVENGSGASAVMETPQPRELALALVSQDVHTGLVVEEKEISEKECQQVSLGGVNVIGLDTHIGPSFVLGQREGKEVMIVEESTNNVL